MLNTIFWKKVQGQKVLIMASASSDVLDSYVTPFHNFQKFACPKVLCKSVNLKASARNIQPLNGLMRYD